jgi:hypothetical protein
VVASFEEPAYLEFIKMRKAQFKKYNIPNMFLFDGVKPLDFGDENDVFFEKAIPPKDIVNPHLNPHMVLKFMKAIRTIDSSNYKFILRINLSTYINFPSLLDELATLPLEKTAFASVLKQIVDIKPYGYIIQAIFILLSGTCMIFTIDFITYLQSYDLNNPELTMHNDDVVLTHLARKFNCKFFNIPMFFWDSGEMTNDLQKYSLIRCKCDDNRLFDVQKWIYLLRTIDGIVYPSYICKSLL